MCLCFKMSLQSLPLKSLLKLPVLKYLNSVDKVACFNVIRSAMTNSCLSGSCFQHLHGFLYKILSTSVKHKEENRDSLQHHTQKPTVTVKTQNYNNIKVKSDHRS